MIVNKYTIKILDYDATVRVYDNVESDIKYIIEVDSIPGLIGGGATFEEALIEATEALQMFLEIKE